MKNTTLVGTSPPQRWAEEYRRGGIPSSVRDRPSNVVVEFLATVREHMPQATRALDIGTGTGRNAIFAAEQGFMASAMDYSAQQIAALQAYAVSRPELRLTAVVADVTKPWPWSDRSIDIAVDAFCFKHQIEMEAIATYITELKRCLVPGGLLHAVLGHA
jgi:cyclopropane fatty-acyl-phospholipid synthase-like methyltransferase